METRDLVTRRTLQRALVLNAVSKPLALGVGAAVAVFAFLLGAAWLLLLAPVFYLAFVATTLFDQEEAARVGAAAYARVPSGRTRAALPAGLAPEITDLLGRARAEEERIAATVAESDLPLETVVAEVGGLSTEMERIAGRAQSISRYLADQRPEEARVRLRKLRDAPATTDAANRARDRAAEALTAQLRLWETMEEELDRFTSEMEHLIASLAIVHGQIVRMDVANETHLQEEVARELSDLRERVGSFAEGMHAAASSLDD